MVLTGGAAAIAREDHWVVEASGLDERQLRRLWPADHDRTDHLRKCRAAGFPTIGKMAITWKIGSSVISYRTAPQAQPPLSVVIGYPTLVWPEEPKKPGSIQYS